jgi:hypothetical protein
MRIYTYVQSQLPSKATDLEFRVVTASVEQYEDWVVAGIIFNDVTSSDPSIILNIYVYHFREGFRNIELFYEINT